MSDSVKWATVTEDYGSFYKGELIQILHRQQFLLDPCWPVIGRKGQAKVIPSSSVTIGEPNWNENYYRQMKCYLITKEGSGPLAHPYRVGEYVYGRTSGNVPHGHILVGLSRFSTNPNVIPPDSVQEVANGAGIKTPMLFHPATASESEMIQRQLFKEGYRWSDGTRRIAYVSRPTLIVFENGDLYAWNSVTHNDPALPQEYKVQASYSFVPRPTILINGAEMDVERLREALAAYDKGNS